MIEKRRSVGVIILGLLTLVTPLLLFYGILPLFFRAISRPIKLDVIGLLLNRLYMLTWVIAGIGILALKNWARNLAVTLAIIGCLGTAFAMWVVFPIIYKVKESIGQIPISLLFLVYYSIIIYFLTRPKVREQFR